MANAIAPHLLEKAQELHQAVLALGLVVDLYMRSSHSNIDDMIYIVHHLFVPIEAMADELNCLLKEAVE